MAMSTDDDNADDDIADELSEDQSVITLRKEVLPCIVFHPLPITRTSCTVLRKKMAFL